MIDDFFTSLILVKLIRTDWWDKIGRHLSEKLACLAGMENKGKTN